MTQKRLKGKRVLAAIAPAGFRCEALQQPEEILESEGAGGIDGRGTLSWMLGAKFKTGVSVGQV